MTIFREKLFLLNTLILLFLVCALLNCRPSLLGVDSSTNSSVTNSSSTSTAIINPSSWAFIDGTGANGINFNTARTSGQPKLAVFNSSLYAKWEEVKTMASSDYQIRVAKYNNNPDSPSWSYADGGLATGLNKDPTLEARHGNMVSFNSKLYTIWHEKNAGTIKQIRVKKYDGSSWAFVDGGGPNGINFAPALNNADDPFLITFNSKLYAVWSESDGTKLQIRASVYNGNDAAPAWTFVDGNGATGLNKVTNQDAQAPRPIVFDNKLYLVWYEINAATFQQIRIVVYNVNDGSPSWSFVDGNGTTGINKDSTKDTQYPDIAVFNSKLYLTWQELSPAPVRYQTRVVVYNGNDSSPVWTFVDGNSTTGLNKSTTQHAWLPRIYAFNNNLYVGWEELNTSGFYQIRLIVYNGNDSSPAWTFVDGNNDTTGLNKDSTQTATALDLIEFGSRLLSAWAEGASNVQIVIKNAQLAQ
ncbi:MAG: hypothetical protein HY072_10610 [Deltaproteobacteria bacterium]|nr:hypothetical protein [Deltaproteobacteria bacterium]